MVSILSLLPGEDAYLAGKTHEIAGRFADAYAAYLSCGAEQGPLAQYALLHAAACRAAGGDPAGAVEEYQRLIDAPQAGPWKRMARVKLGFLLAGQGNRTDAAPLFSSALAVDPVPWWLDAYQWRAAEELLASPSTMPQAAAYFREALRRSKTWSYRHDAALRLARSPSRDDKIQALWGMVESAAYNDAKTLLAELCPHDSSSDPAALRWRYLQGRIYLGTGKPIEGLELLETIVQTDPASEWAPKARAWAARHLATVALRSTPKQEEAQAQAVNAFDRLVSEYPAAETTGDALWWWARALVGKDDVETAVEQFLRLVDRCPDHDRADDALISAARLLRDKKQPERAASLCARLTDQFPKSPFVSEAWCLRGSFLGKTDNKKEAAQCFLRATRGPLGDYYAHRAAARIKRSESNAGTDVPGATHNGKALLRTLSHHAPGQRPTTQTVPDDEQFQRLSFFGHHGFEEAEWEAVSLFETTRNKETSIDTPSVCRLLAESGLVVTAERFAQAFEWGQKDAAPLPEYLRVQFPLAYWRLATKNAHDAGLDPFLLLAVSRQESTFRPGLTSRANARGLMQVLPSTAQWLIDVDPGVGIASPPVLEDPHTSLRLGAFYLRRMLSQFDGNLVFALAAYNAGPGNLSKWRKSLPTHDMDGFIEAIPFEETRTYVKRRSGITQPTMRWTARKPTDTDAASDEKSYGLNTIASVGARDLFPALSSAWT
ncbi:MAG TPA: transglycosylase SLT domain-containing protein [Candidatus Hydrogenedentes bacterium]|nr:transglycosylase SLT domain-containing protein [Candidatus Hydrogenedentota bacterium]